MNEEVPPHRLVFRGERMKGRHVVVASVLRIAACLEDEHRIAGLNKPRGDRSTSGAGADDNEISGGGRLVGTRLA